MLNRDARAQQLARGLFRACEMDVIASKPGNVSLASPGHRMTAHDFLASAAAITAPMTRPDASVGQRILGAIEATQASVGCNTNLGIVLLCAPLTQAALGDSGDLRRTLRDVLDNLDMEDARLAYQAIRLANPAGLGTTAEHDVATTPRISLRRAMIEAASRDSVANQYANCFEDVFIARDKLAADLLRGRSLEQATVAIYLDLLARLPDSHIARKFGFATAQRISTEAAQLVQELDGLEQAAEVARSLSDWDAQLKASNINPGTSADLTVAALYAHEIDCVLRDQALNACGATSHPQATQPWEQSRILAY